MRPRGEGNGRCVGAAGGVPGTAGSTGAGGGGPSSRRHPSPSFPADLGPARCCYDRYGNNFNVFCSSEMLRLALFGRKAA